MAKQRPIRIEGVYKLPHGFSATFATLGTSVRTTIGGVPTTVRMPRVVGSPDHPNLKAPPLLGVTPRRPLPADEDWWYWGKVYTWNQTDPSWGGAHVDALALRLSSQPRAHQSAEAAARKAVERVQHALPAWFRSMRDWIEVLTEQDLDPDAPLRSVSGGPDTQFWMPGMPRVDLQPTLAISVIARDEDPLTPRAWRTVVRLVENSTTPSDDHLILRDARAALRRGAFRRAVLDSGTVLEIALWRLLFAEHVAHPSTLGAELIWQAERWTLWRLAEAVKTTATRLPPHLAKDIILRNAVTHKQAKKPTRDEAIRMVAGAREVLLLTAPLPPL